MKNSSFKIISAVIAVIFAVSIILFAGSIISGKNNNSEKAAEIFNSLAYKTATAAQQYEPSGQSHSQFASEFVKAVHDDFEQFASISLTLNDSVIYNYPPVNNFQLDTNAVIQKRQEITTLYGNTIKLEASVYKINPANVYYKARIPFLLILTGTIAAFFILIFVPASKNSTEENEEKADDDSWDSYTNYDDSEITFETESESDEQDEEIKFPEETPIEEEIQPEVKSDENELPAEEPEEEPLNDPENESEDDTIVEQSAPKSLKEFLSDELSYEDSEVSVLITKINHLDKNSQLALDIQKKILETFNNQGVLFNFNEDSYATILVETDFDTAMNQAETLRSNLLEIINASKFNTEITIGVSSKTSRKIDADDLIYEADQAQQHAEADNPVVGLKVDPEKYNQTK